MSHPAEVAARGPDLAASQVERFWREGWLVQRGVFEPQEIEGLRARVADVVARDDGTLLGTLPSGARHLRTDLVSRPEFRAVPTDPRVLAVARALLGDALVYFGDSTLQVGAGERGWHRDNRLPDRFDRAGLDWEGRYPLVRFGVYLQDHARHSGGLGVRTGSHLWQRAPGRPSPSGSGLWARVLRRRIAREARLFGQGVHVDSAPGDVVVWNLRTTHSGNAVRLKAFPRLRLHPGLEGRLPRWLTLPAERERMAFFFTIAARSAHTDRYVDYLRTRDYAVEVWRRSAYDDDARRACRDAGLELREVSLPAP